MRSMETDKTSNEENSNEIRRLFVSANGIPDRGSIESSNSGIIANKRIRNGGDKRLDISDSRRSITRE
jgi:hypothetical protein